MKKNDEDLEAQLAEADLRRKALEEERTKKLAEISGLDKIEKVELLDYHMNPFVFVTKYFFLLREDFSKSSNRKQNKNLPCRRERINLKI